MKLRKPRPDVAAPNIVETIAAKTAQAAELARIEGQKRLQDPLTNPATRAHAERLRDRQQRQILDAEDARRARSIRVADRRASDAEKALEAIRAAREVSSAARSVLALHRSRTLYLRITLTASLALSAGAAIGVGSLAHNLGAPRETGWIAEVGFTVLTTLVINWRSQITQHDGRSQLKGWRGTAAWILMAAPLLASMTANAYGSGPVGIACSVGAAAFAFFAYLIADVSAGAIQHNASKVDASDEDELRSVAGGGEFFTDGHYIEEPEPEPLPADHGLSDDELVSLGYEAARARAYLAARGVDLPAATFTRTLAAGPSPRPVREEVSAAATDLSSGLRIRSEGERQEVRTRQVPPAAAKRSVPSAKPNRSTDLPKTDQVHEQPDPDLTGADLDRSKTSRSRTRRVPADRLDEALAADALYMQEHGRHIPAEKLARTLSIGKPAALELVKQVRGTQMEVAR